MVRIKKTKVGSEYRVRDSQGQLRGEFNKRQAAVKRAIKATNPRKS